MAKNVYLNGIAKKYKIKFIHNPKHFFMNSLFIETKENGQKVLCGKARPGHKNFHTLAVLKPILTEKQEVIVQSIKNVKAKPFYGLLQD